MSNSPDNSPENSSDPMNPQALKRATLVGALLGVIAIVAFVVLWIVLGQAGTANAPRLFISLCIPPALLGIIVGVYVLYIRSRRSL